MQINPNIQFVPETFDNYECTEWWHKIENTNPDCEYRRMMIEANNPWDPDQWMVFLKRRNGW